MKKYLSSVEKAREVGGKPISKALARSSMGYGISKDNIGNIPKFGSIIFSPPYFDALSVTKGGGSKSSILYEESTKELQMKRSGPFAVKKNLPTPYSSKEGNIGNISEFGSIVFSPPYFCSISDVVKSRYLYPKTKRGVSRRQEYSGDPNNIGNIPYFGSVTLSQDKKNISNVQYGRTYLGEMFKVYSECFRVLKPNKFMVVVVKDIRRKGLTIPLGADTIKLCQMVGFEFF